MPLVRQQRFRLLPKLFLDPFVSRIAADARVAREHTSHVAVQNGATLAECEDADGRSGGSPHAGQCVNRFELARERARVALDDQTRGLMQIAPACVVAQPAPMRQHLILVRRGQRSDVGKASDEALIVGDHRAHLSLLEHDLRHPDAVRIARVLPGEIVPAVLALPLDDARREGRSFVARRLTAVIRDS